MTVKPEPLVVGQSVKFAIIDASTYDISRPIVIETKCDEFEFLRLESNLIMTNLAKSIVYKRKPQSSSVVIHNFFGRLELPEIAVSIKKNDKEHGQMILLNRQQYAKIRKAALIGKKFKMIDKLNVHKIDQYFF